MKSTTILGSPRNSFPFIVKLLYNPKRLYHDFVLFLTPAVSYIEKHQVSLRGRGFAVSFLWWTLEIWKESQ